MRRARSPGALTPLGWAVIGGLVVFLVAALKAATLLAHLNP